MVYGECVSHTALMRDEGRCQNNTEEAKLEEKPRAR